MQIILHSDIEGSEENCKKWMQWLEQKGADEIIKHMNPAFEERFQLIDQIVAEQRSESEIDVESSLTEGSLALVGDEVESHLKEMEVYEKRVRSLKSSGITIIGKSHSSRMYDIMSDQHEANAKFRLGEAYFSRNDPDGPTKLSAEEAFLRRAYVGGMHFSPMPIFINQKAVDELECDWFETDFPEVNSFYDYGFLDKKVGSLEKESGLERVYFGVIKISDEGALELYEEDLLEEASTILTSLMENFGHDFFHTLTIAEGIDGPDIIYDLEVTSFRDANKTNGLEEFSLQLNQTLFLMAREDESDWYKGLLELVDETASFLSKVKNTCSKELYEATEEMAFELIANFVDKDKLRESKPESWSKILAESSVISSDAFIYHGDAVGVTGVLKKLMGAIEKDYGYIQSQPPSRDILPNRYDPDLRI